MVLDAEDDGYRLFIVEYTGLSARVVSGVWPGEVSDFQRFGSLPFGAFPVGIGAREDFCTADGIVHSVPLGVKTVFVVDRSLIITKQDVK